MKSIENGISSLGFGAYRISQQQPQHAEALILALQSGCTLIDTASTYTDGDSELVIGTVLRANPQYRPFIISKAGYVQGKALELMKELKAHNLAKGRLVKLGPDSWYSLDQSFLRRQVETSCRRLGRSTIDAYLVHNPERYLNGVHGAEERMYAKLRGAFECLERLVELGTVRWYGISTNAIPGWGQPSLSVARVIEIAHGVCDAHHFKILEMPVNLLERGAVTSVDGNPTMVEEAHSHGLVVVASRPLNAIVDGRLIRLVSAGEQLECEDSTARIIQRCGDTLAGRITAIDCDSTKLLAIVQGLMEQLLTADASTSERLYYDVLYPIILKVYLGAIPDNVAICLEELHERARMLCRNRMAMDTERALRGSRYSTEELLNGGVPLQLAACSQYLSWGIDHVMVGMRRSEYVRMMSGHFNPCSRNRRTKQVAMS